MAKSKKKEKQYIPKLRNLFNYQKDLIDNSKKNYMYITDTGTGKSLVSIHHYLKYRKNGDTKLIIVAPAQKVKEKGWEREIKNVEFSENVTISNYEVITYAEIVKRTKHILDMKTKKGIGEIRNKMFSELFNETFFIVDECHYMKNRTSKRSKALFNSLRASEGWCLLSATPYPNGYIDLGVYLAIAGFYESPYEYELKNATYDEKLLKFKDARVPKREDEYWQNRQKIDNEFKQISSKPLKKEECLDLPELVKVTNLFPKSSEYIELEAIFGTFLSKFSEFLELKSEEKNNFDKKIKEIHDDFLQKLVKQVSTYRPSDYRTKVKVRKEKEEAKKNVSEFKMKFYQKLDDELDNVAKVFTLSRQYANILDKTEYLMEFLESTDNNVLIFYNFNIEFENIMKAIKENPELENKAIYEVRGGVTKLPDFDDYKDLKNTITLVQIQAGGAGIELQYCTDVVYFSPTWAYQDYFQSLGRAYRHGQEKKVTVYEYIVEGSVEEYLKYVLLNNKKDFDFSMLVKLFF